MDEKELAQTLMQQPLEQPLDQQVCKYCHLGVSSDDYFCPHCGKKLKNKPLSTSMWHQLGVYLFSVIAPPLGLPFAYRYFKQGGQKSATIGWIIIALTAVSIVINVWFVYDFIQTTQKQINTDMNQEFAPIYTQ